MDGTVVTSDDVDGETAGLEAGDAAPGAAPDTEADPAKI